MGKTFYKGIIDPVLMGYYTLATEAMPFTIDLRTGAIGIYILTNGAANTVFVHRKTPLKRCVIQNYPKQKNL
ncbi:MAG: hypothetical protein ABIL06_22335 [Pseudomonadota bacterium]